MKSTSRSTTSKGPMGPRHRPRPGHDFTVPVGQGRDGRVLPEGIKLGFICDDDVREYEKLPPGRPFPKGQRFLYSGQKPALGQYLTVHVSLTRKMRDIGEATDWFRVGGRVVNVIDERTVVALVSPTTLNTPLIYERGWHIVLRFDSDHQFPWVLQWMGRADH